MRKMVFGLMVVGLLLVGANAFAAGDLIVNGKIGVGTTTPVTSLDVNGGIKVGNVTAACTASLNGVIRYSGTALEFCNGTAWQLLSSGTVPNSDPNTKLLLHMDGTNGSATFTDSSASAHSVTANGNAKISTAQSKFSGASGLFDGSGDYIAVPASSDFNFGSGDFTIDFWMRWNGSPGNTGITGQSNGGGGTLKWAICWNAINANNLTLHIQNPAGTIHNINWIWTPSENTWYHLAVVRSGSNWYLFVDGIQTGGTQTDSVSMPDVSSTLRVGSDGEGWMYLNGYIDELRISKGIARWTSNFTPPTTPY